MVPAMGAGARPGGPQQESAAGGRTALLQGTGRVYRTISYQAEGPAASDQRRPASSSYMVRNPPPKSTIVRMWILHNRVTLGPYITDTRARTRHWSCNNHRHSKEPSHDSSRQYYICRLRVHVTPSAVDVGSLACLLLRNATIVCNRRGWYVDTSAWNKSIRSHCPNTMPWW
eukprot:SAG25_NODE_40_length_19529_cov_9.183942_4_plen_172_part_00